MKDTALYEQLLGLKSPWSVKKVDLSLADQRVVVKIILKKGQRHRLVGAGHLLKGLPQGAELAPQCHARGVVAGGLTALDGMGGQVHALCGADGAVGIGAQLKAFAPHAAAVVLSACAVKADAATILAAGIGWHCALDKRTCQCCLSAPAPGRSSRRIG